MVWHRWTFYASLVLWAVAVTFITPEEHEDPRSFSKLRGATRSSSFPWQNIGVTLICAVIMWLGYHKLRLHMDGLTDALASAQSVHNDPGRVIGPEEVATMTGGIVACHDRLSSFIPIYSVGIEEIDKKIRDNVTQLVDDAASWNVEISKIMWEMRTESRRSWMSSREDENLPLRRCRSADCLSPRESITPIYTPTHTPAYTPPTPLWSPLVPGMRPLRPTPLFSRARRSVHLTSPEAEQQAALKMSLRQLGMQTRHPSSAPCTPDPSRPPMPFASRQALKNVRMGKVAARGSMVMGKPLLKTNVKTGHSDAVATEIKKPGHKSPTSAEAPRLRTMADLSSLSSSETSGTSQEPTSTTTSKTEDSDFPEAQRQHELALRQGLTDVKVVTLVQRNECDVDTRGEVLKTARLNPEVIVEEETTANPSTALLHAHQPDDTPQPGSLPECRETSRVITSGGSQQDEKPEDNRVAPATRASDNECDPEKPPRHIPASTGTAEQAQTKQA